MFDDIIGNDEVECLAHALESMQHLEFFCIDLEMSDSMPGVLRVLDALETAATSHSSNHLDTDAFYHCRDVRGTRNSVIHLFSV